MSSLADIVSALSNKSSTLDWDVVVNYSVQELNALLQVLREKGQNQLTKLNVQLPGFDEDDRPFTTSYFFELGTPVIQFDPYALVPSCSLSIPVIGGSVQTTRKTWTIYPEIYRLAISGIPLATANDSYRHPQSSDKTFYFPPTPGATAVVTLDLTTSTKSLVVDLQISPADQSHHVHKIDAEKANLVEKIRDFFKDPGQVSYIRWDLARINNSRPLNRDEELVPRSFQFAVYVPEGSDDDGVLSLFIQTRDKLYGQQGALQAKWSRQWSEYGVSPIPYSHTASVLFNNQMILELINKSFSKQNMKAEPLSGDGLKWKVLTHRRFVLPGKVERDIGWAGGSSIGYNGAQVNLDQDPNTLFVTLGQHNGPYESASAHLEWSFQYSTQWWEDIETMSGSSNSGGTLRISNRLEPNTTKGVNDSFLPTYLLNFDLNLNASDWETPDVKADQPDFWGRVSGQTGWTPQWFGKDLPTLPTLYLKLLYFDFFMTTNLLLPNQKVISFDSEPGVRIPRDIYLVGNIMGQNGDKEGDIIRIDLNSNA